MCMTTRPSHPRNFRRSRGFTLLEVMIASALTLIVTTAAFSCARTQTRQLGLTAQNVDISQTGRAALEMIIDDARYAGAGLGVRADGQFPGILSGDFTIGSAHFGASALSKDLGIVIAGGPYATIAAFDNAG